MIQKIHKYRITCHDCGVEHDYETVSKNSFPNGWYEDNILLSRGGTDTSYYCKSCWEKHITYMANAGCEGYDRKLREFQKDNVLKGET